MFSLIAVVIGAVIAGVVGIVKTTYENDANQFAQDQANYANQQMTRETNESNLQAVRETNAANVEQANLAYQRSLPVNQVRDLMNAGMSKAGALNKLAGGGVYSSPALATANMQSSTQQPAHFNYSGIAEAMDRLSNIPSNVQQSQLVTEQLNKMRQDAEYARMEEKRKQEMHDLELDERKYSKWERESQDELFSLMENTAQEKNIQPKQGQSMHDYMRALGLHDHPLYKKLSASNRQRAFDKYLQQQNELRANIESQDKHNLSVAEFQRLKDAHTDFESAKDARTKEYAARALQAQVTAIAAERGISYEEMISSLESYRGADGKLHQKPERSIAPLFSEFWNTVFTAVPLSALSEAFFKGVKIGK